MSLLFEWDPKKAQINIEKHGVTFDEASTTFSDIYSVTVSDPLHSEDEDRFILIGFSHRNRLLIVAHTYRGDMIRIISARIATRREQQQYEENAK
jgi:uncharacterized DUF497 family protein